MSLDFVHSDKLMQNPIYLSSDHNLWLGFIFREWLPKQISNPNFFVDETPFDFPAIGAVAIEVMSNFGGTSFDNILIATSADAASKFATQTYGIKVLCDCCLYCKQSTMFYASNFRHGTPLTKANIRIKLKTGEY